MDYSNRPKNMDIWEPIPNIAVRTDLTETEREAEYQKAMAEISKLAEKNLAESEKIKAKSGD